MKLGEPIWVESLLTDEEYKIESQKYPGSYTNGNKKPQMFDCEFKWRYKMGANMEKEEIKNFNAKLTELLKKKGLVTA